MGLAVSAVGTLLYKRHTERHQRQLIVWFMDASKQAFAGGLQHVVNMIMGLKFGKDGNECAWYILNSTITCFCGLFILTYWMRAYNWLVQKHNLRLLKSGDYGNPP